MRAGLLHERLGRHLLAGERKRTALDWMAVAVEENGREILEVYLAAARRDDWRAAEAL